MEAIDKLLEVKGLRVYYYTLDGIVRAVDNVYIDIRRGEILALVGESGSGKSTLGYAIVRLVPPPGRIVSGEIVFKGINLLNIDDKDLDEIRGKKITMIFQDPMASLNPVFRIGEQMTDIIMSKLHIDREKAWEIAVESLRKARLPNPEEVMEKYPHELSGGMMQRVLIALAISTNPDLIIADEPTTALDVTTQAQILKLIYDLSRSLKTSVLLITHNMGIVAEVADRVAVMYAGKIVEIGPVMDVLEKPLHPYTRALLRSVPRIDSSIERLEAIKGEVPSLINPPSGCRFHPRCPHVFDRCRVEEPPLIEVEKDHYVACWLYVRR